MIENSAIPWFAAGLSAGVLQATMLWRTARRLTSWTPALGVLRLALVSLVLVVAAVSGAILAAAAGWAVGFIALCGWIVAKGTGQAFLSRNTPSSK